MLPEKIMQSDILDIIFENKNKLYGAYALRKSYNKTLVSAISVTFFIAMAFCLLQIMHHSKQIDSIIPFIIPPDNVLTAVDPVKPLPEKTVATPPAANHIKQIITSTPVIVSDNEKTDMPDEDEINRSIISNKSFAGDDVVESIEMPAGTTQGKATVAVPVAAPVENAAPLNWAQVMPEFPGGVQALQKFMQRNLKQPDNLNAGEKIVVRAFFVVNKNGQIEQVKITVNGRPDLDKEVMRVINKMPLWKPGQQNGNAVAVYFNLPVTFISTETE